MTTKQLGAWLQRENIDYPKLGESLHIDALHGWRAAAFCISCLPGWLKSRLLQQYGGLAVQAGRATPPTSNRCVVANAPAENSTFDDWMGISTGSGALYGVTGGVTESVLRQAPACAVMRRGREGALGAVR